MANNVDPGQTTTPTHTHITPSPDPPLPLPARVVRVNMILDEMTTGVDPDQKGAV